MITRLIIFSLLSYLSFANSNAKKDTLHFDLRNVDVEGSHSQTLGVSRLMPVESDGIYAGRKSEIVDLDAVMGNLAVNNGRQVFAKIAGLNVWEGEAGGLQLSIGGRGLNPNRVSNFNTRQNGYDISADALGYPESYYTPPTEALDRIEIVRGAAALQYGTQFGGFINFKLKDGPANDAFQFNTRQTAGSFGLFNSFNSFSGQSGDVNYYSYLQYKTGDGWRDNSAFDQYGAFVKINYDINEKFSSTLEITKMYYLAQQAGGLNDMMFNDDASQSIRTRNWFEVDWNLFALNFDYEFNSSLNLNSRNFALIAERGSLGYLGIPSRLEDPDVDRDLILGEYLNFGNETRLLYRYMLNDQPNALITGFRVYKGRTQQEQGLSDNGTGANFNLNNPNNPEYSSFEFPSTNLALFAENLFNVTENFSITPGVRFEHISTNSDGFYNKINRDLAGNIILAERINEELNNSRSFLLYGIGLSYYESRSLEVYGNFSRNYRAINFNDLRIVNPNQRIDQNLKDESGFSIDLGFRGNIKDLIDFDINFFLLNYKNRIGEDLRVDSVLSTTYRFRTNISDSRSLGIESFVELDILRSLNIKSNSFLSVFTNFSFINARYINSPNPTINDNMVENSPEIIFRSGIVFLHKKLRSNIQYSYTSEHFTDATNTRFSNSGLFGTIPAYSVVDFTVEYDFDWFIISAGVNNLFNEVYFTRRATGYPGPGIIPSDPRNFFFTIDYKI